MALFGEEKYILKIKNVSAFEIIKEKRSKIVKDRYVFYENDIKSEKYSDFRKYLVENFINIISHDETDYTARKSTFRASIILTPYRISGKAFIFKIKMKDKLLDPYKLLNNLLNSDYNDFLSYTTELAYYFKDLGRWRGNVFLIFTKFYLKWREIETNFIVLFLTDLEIGKNLILDPEKVAELIRRPTFNRIVKKGAIFPYPESADKLNYEKIKVYISEGSSIPGYLFEFLALEKPTTAETILTNHLVQVGGAEALFTDTNSLPLKEGIKITLINDKGTKIEFDIRELVEERVTYIYGNGKSGILVKGNFYNVKIGDERIRGFRLEDLYR